MTASPEVLCSQVHAVHPLLCRDVQLFHFRRHSDGKTSAGERTTADRDAKRKKKKKIQRFTRLLSHPKNIKRGKGTRGDRGTDGHSRSAARAGGEADRHGVETVMSNWSDTREGGRQTEMSGGETDRTGRRERNLCETCHNKVSSAKNTEKGGRGAVGDAQRFGETYAAM